MPLEQHAIMFLADDIDLCTKEKVLTTKNTHLKYGGSITYRSKVTAKQRNRQTGQKLYVLIYDNGGKKIHADCQAIQ